MGEKAYREKTDVEAEFLRIVTKGHPEIESQIDSCLIADFDPTGWCDVLVSSGLPSREGAHVDGPSLKRGDPKSPSLYFDIGFSLNSAGMLTAVEFIVYIGSLASPYETVVGAQKNGELVFPPRS